MSGHKNIKVVVLGTGIMGSGIAAGFAAGGARVVVLGRTAENSNAACVKAAAFANELNGAAKTSAAAVTGGLIDSWNDWDGVDIVIETVAEDLALKQALFAQLDARVPVGVPVGSNSSGFPISTIAAGLKTASRMFGMHYFMPAHVVPLVEVVLGGTSDAAIGARVCELFSATGKKPVLVKKDIPGFLANRIQHALMREALSLIDAGIASPEDVDLAVRYSFGFRYAAVGPILQKEISGWDTVRSAAQAIYPSLSNTAAVPQCLEQMVGRGQTGMKSGQGFFAWPPEAIAKTKRSYEQKLAAAFAILQSDS